jgi:hypothetical protein
LTGGPKKKQGKVGQAIDCKNGQITVSDPANGGLDFGAASFSVSAWIYWMGALPNGGSFNGFVYKGGYTATAPGYYLGVNTDKYQIGFGLADGDEAFTAYDNADVTFTNKWFHVVGVVDRTSPSVGNTKYLYRRCPR